MLKRLRGMGLAVALVLPGVATATLIDRGSGLIYDDVLDITWLQDANLAATNTFGVAGINANGTMSWDVATNSTIGWIAAMNADGGTGYLGFNDWRLPTLSPIAGGTSFNPDFSNNATSDFGYAKAGRAGPATLSRRWATCTM